MMMIVVKIILLSIIRSHLHHHRYRRRHWVAAGTLTDCGRAGAIPLGDHQSLSRVHSHALALVWGHRLAHSYI